MFFVQSFVNGSEQKPHLHTDQQDVNADDGNQHLVDAECYFLMGFFRIDILLFFNLF
jgi:hypothetical protein